MGERAEPVNEADAPAHPRYLKIVDTGEVRYHGFLGVPIIQRRKVLGVLVARQVEERQFGEAEVTFLFTLAAQLAGAISFAQASGELAALQQPGETFNRFLQGRPGAPGVGVGAIVVAYAVGGHRHLALELHVQLRPPGERGCALAANAARLWSHGLRLVVWPYQANRLELGEAIARVSQRARPPSFEADGHV